MAVAEAVVTVDGIEVDRSEYLRTYGSLPASGYTEYQIGKDIHGYSAAFAFEQSLAYAVADAKEKGVKRMIMRLRRD